MELLLRAFADWLNGLQQSIPKGTNHFRIRRNFRLPGGVRCSFITLTTMPSGGPAQPSLRIVDLWDLGPGPVGPEGVRMMSLKIQLVEAWSWDHLECSEVQGRQDSGLLEVRGNLVGRTIGDESIFEVLGNSGRSLRFWTHKWDGSRLRMNPYVPPEDSSQLSSDLDDFLAEPESETVLSGPEVGLAGASSH